MVVHNEPDRFGRVVDPAVTTGDYSSCRTERVS